MKRIGYIGALLVTGLTLVGSAWVSSPDAGAAGKPKAAASAAPVEAPTTKDPIKLAPEGIKFGMTIDEVGALYDKLVDADNVPRYKKVQPGPSMNALDAEIQEAKAGFRRTRIDFGTLPTGIDQTPLAGEYGYKNNESMLWIGRLGVTRYFFFVGGKLWKFYDEIPLKEGGDFGATYQTAFTALVTKLGAPGRVLQPDFQAGRSFTETDWVDAYTHVRAVDRSGMGILGLVYEERSTAANLAAVHKAAASQTAAIDPAIQMVTRSADGGTGPLDHNANVADAFTGKSHGGANQPPQAGPKK